MKIKFIKKDSHIQTVKNRYPLEDTETIDFHFM